MPILMIFYSLSNYIDDNGYKLGIYIVPDGSLGGKTKGISASGIKNVVLVTESVGKTIAAHEVGHAFGDFCDEYEYGDPKGWFPTNPEYGLDWDEESYPHGYVAADGWNVEGEDHIRHSAPRISVNRSEPTNLQFNHFSFINPIGSWITRTNYSTLLDKLVAGGSGLRTVSNSSEIPTVRVIGSFYEDGTFELYNASPSTDSEDNPALTLTRSLPSLAGKRLTLSFEPVSESDR